MEGKEPPSLPSQIVLLLSSRAKDTDCFRPCGSDLDFCTIVGFILDILFWAGYFQNPPRNSIEAETKSSVYHAQLQDAVDHLCMSL